MFRNRHRLTNLVPPVSAFVMSVKNNKGKTKGKWGFWGVCARSSFMGKKKKIIVAAGVYPCLYPCPYLQRRFHRRFQNSATTCQTSPRRRVIPQFEPWDHRHAEAKADRAHRIVPATRPLRPTRLEKQTEPGHRRTNDDDDDDRRSENHLCEKRCRPRYHSRRVESA